MDTSMHKNHDVEQYSMVWARMNHEADEQVNLCHGKEMYFLYRESTGKTTWQVVVEEVVCSLGFYF